MNLAALRARLAAIAARLTALRGQAELTEAELTEIDALTTEHGTVTANINRLVNADNAIAASNSGASAGRQVGPVSTAAALAAAAAMTVAGIAGPGIAAQIGNVQDRIYTDPMRGFRSTADFALTIRNAFLPGGTVDSRLDVIRREQMANQMPASVQVGAVTYLNEGNAADSGWAVPPQMREGIWEVAYGGNDIINMVAWEPTNSNTVEFNADESTPWGTTGVRAYWRNEAGAMTKSKPEAPEPRVVRINELYAFIEATDELLEDAPRLESRLIQRAGRAINWTASEALINGNGVGKPLGWMQGSNLITVAKEAGQAGSTVVLNNITKMLIRIIRQGSGGKLLWLGNQDILPALVPMAIGNYPIFMPVGSRVQDALQDGSLLGVPLQWNDHCKTLGTVGDLQLLNLEGYYALRRTDVKYASSIHLHFDIATTSFRWTFRFGGMPYMKSAIAPANGSSTRSHFVALADRA